MASNRFDSKLIITATTAPSWLYPAARRWPETPMDYAKEVIAAYEAGAAIGHIHGKEKWSKDFYQETFDLIRDKCDIILQMGLSGLTLDDRRDLMQTKPEMLSIILNHHDEYFPEMKLQLYHTQQELMDYCKICNTMNIKPEFEQWHQGSNWNLNFLIEKHLVEKPYFLSIFLGWPGGAWSPPTIEEVTYRLNSIVDDSLCTVSTMGHEQTKISTMAILLGAHVRVGYEDNPYYLPGILARDTGELVARIKRIAKELNRETADPSEARKMIKTPMPANYQS